MKYGLSATLCSCQPYFQVLLPNPVIFHTMAYINDVKVENLTDEDDDEHKSARI